MRSENTCSSGIPCSGRPQRHRIAENADVVEWRETGKRPENACSSMIPWSGRPQRQRIAGNAAVVEKVEKGWGGKSRLPGEGKAACDMIEIRSDCVCSVYSMRKEGSGSVCDGAEGSGKTWMSSVSETGAAALCSPAGAGISNGAAVCISGSGSGTSSGEGVY